jgi:uncharacterized protein YndB with AHSA1/START domain
MSGELGEISLCYTVTFDRTSKYSAKRLWSAVTDPLEIGEWMGYPARVDLRVGGDWYVDFSGTNDGALTGVIVRVEPEHTLAYVWGLSVVEWTLTDAPGGCSYRFVQAGLPDRGVGADEEGLPAGWHDFIDQLDRHLDGIHLTSAQRHANWLDLKPAYREQLDRVLVPRRVNH